MGLRASMDAVEKRKFLNLPRLELRPLGLPARSQSLYRLRYPGSYCAIRSGDKATGILKLGVGGQLLIPVLTLQRYQYVDYTTSNLGMIIEGIWKRAVMAYSRYHPGIGVEELRVAGIPAEI
jgi:hypothetical protein